MTSQPASRSATASIRRLLSRISPGESGRPSSTSSSPVDRTAARILGYTDTVKAFTIASTPSTGGVISVPAASTTSPGFTSSPAGRTASPGCTLDESRTVCSFTISESSTMTTASAPAGIGAPVMIRIASPRASTRSVAAPAATSATT